MKDRSIGVRELARRLGFSGHYLLQNRLAGKTPWKIDDIELLAASLELTVNELWAQLMDE